MSNIPKKANNEIRGIEGLRPREPVFAVLRVGRKSESGAPIDRDRFFFASPVERNATFQGSKGPYQSVFRPLHAHPQFQQFHGRTPEHRRSIKGVLIHGTAEDCWGYNLGAQELPAPWPKHPNRAPACQGTNKVALRYFGSERPSGFEKAEVGADGYGRIPCGDACPYRQRGPNKGPLCKPKGRLLFRLFTKDLPACIVKLNTQSWFTVQSIQGFFEHVELQAATLLGGELPNLFGLPFFLRLEERSTPVGTFPVMTMTPAVDLQDWLLGQRQRLAALQGKSAPPPVRLSDPEEQDAAALDFADIEMPAAALPEHVPATSGPAGLGPKEKQS